MKNRLTEEAQDRVIENMGVAFRVAEVAARITGLPQAELYAEALYLLCKGAVWWKPKGDRPFTPFAWWFLRRKLKAYCHSRRKVVPTIRLGEWEKEVVGRSEGPNHHTASLLDEVRGVLSREEFELVWAIHGEGIPAEDFTGELGIGRSAVHKRAQAALKKVRRILGVGRDDRKIGRPILPSPRPPGRPGGQACEVGPG